MANGFSIITSRDNTFFTNNKMAIGSDIPTSGSYKVGDIIISDSQANGIFGWVCTQEGTPGKWEVIGSGAGSGGVNSVLVEYSNVVEFTDARTSIDIGINDYNKETDSLEVHYNGLLLAEDVHYSINEAGTTITNLNGSWNANADDTQAMIFVVRKSTAGLNVVPMRNIIDINNDTMEVEMGISNFNPISDIISVHLNGVLLMKDVDYRIENGKIIKVDQSEAWNPNNVVGQKMYIEVLRNKGSLNEPSVGSIGKEHLNDELAGEINNNTNNVNSLTKIVNDHTTLINNLTEQVGNVDFSEVEAKIGNLPSLQTNAKDSLVDAVNELFQSANNGKELIANAIGEPLNSNDTFSAMSNDINGLLSTFKTNMMNNGVVVEGTDKFKQLIEKLATLTDSEGKGLQMTNGTFSYYHPIENDYGELETTTVKTGLNFNPTLIIVNCTLTTDSYPYTILTNGYISNLETFTYKTGTIDKPDLNIYIDNITKESFNLNVSTTVYCGVQCTDWYAIGVGEDPALRDSLASILQEEGVTVTEEDDMASLISKVDSEFDRKNANSGLDIISATKLPATGKENQICVITDNPVDNFIITGNSAESNNDKIVIYNSTGNSNYNIIKNNITYSYNIGRVMYQSNYLFSYYWGDNQWNQLTVGNIVLFENGEFLNTDITGGFGIATGTTISNSEFAFVGPRDYSLLSTTRKEIVFSNFKTLKVTLYSSTNITFVVGSFKGMYSGRQSSSFSTTDKTNNEYSIQPSTSATEISISVSGWTTGYLGFFRSAQTLAPSIYITKITLE